MEGFREIPCAGAYWSYLVVEGQSVIASYTSLTSFCFWKLMGRAAHMPLQSLALPAGMRLG